VDLSERNIEVPGPLGAIVLSAPDHALNALRFAQRCGVPYATVTPWLTEASMEAVAASHRPGLPVLLASHWWAGAATMLTLQAASLFTTVASARIVAIVDDEDAAGPATDADMGRSAGVPAFALHDGQRAWLSGADAQSTLITADGRVLETEAYSLIDIASLSAALGAPNIRFDLATGESTSRRRCGALAAELVVEIEGEMACGKARSRSILEYPGGQANFTGLSLAILLTHFLPEMRSAPSGLQLPETVVSADVFLGQLERAGTQIAHNLGDMAGDSRR